MMKYLPNFFFGSIEYFYGINDTTRGFIVSSTVFFSGQPSLVENCLFR